MGKGVLVLSGEDTRGLVSMPEAIGLMEDAYAELGHGRAQVVNREWLRVALAPGDAQPQFVLNVIPGAVPAHGAAGIRLSARHAGASNAGAPSGFVLVWDPRTLELLGIVHDDVVSPLRVGATSALGAKYLCRTDVRVAGLVGSGRQAAGQIAGLLAIRPGIREVKVYSRQPQRRERFAAWVRRTFGVEAVAVDSAERCVRGSEVVFTATSAARPVVEGRWLEPGVHVCGMIGTPRGDPRRELDDDVARRADVVVVNSVAQARADEPAELASPVAQGLLTWERVRELADLCTGRITGRANHRQITWHNNNAGMGVQFVSLCRRMIDVAREKGIGTELPAHLFATPAQAREDHPAS